MATRLLLLAISMSAYLTSAAPLYCNLSTFVHLSKNQILHWQEIPCEVLNYYNMYYCFLSPGIMMAAFCSDN